MSFNLGHGRELDDAPGDVGVGASEYPPLPDSILTDREAGRLDPRRWFADASRPFEIEIGCGKGTFIVNQGAASPEVNYLGIEWAREFYMYAADRVRRRELRNVRMLHADATDFLKWRCPAGIVRVIHLYFSDPWPKTKHHKNRVIQDSFLAEVSRVLAVGGELRVVTDHDALWEWDKGHFGRWTEGAGGESQSTTNTADTTRSVVVPRPFALLPFTPPPWVGEGETIGTNYERKFKKDDRPPHACTLRKDIGS